METSIMENQMEKNMENEMETGIVSISPEDHLVGSTGLIERGRQHVQLLRKHPHNALPSVTTLERPKSLATSPPPR